MNTTTLHSALNPALNPALHPAPAAEPSLPVPREAATPHALAGGCFVLVLLLGLLSNGHGWLNDKLKTPRPASGWQSLMSGAPMQLLADAMASTLLPQTAARLERAFSWLAVRDLGPRVREGQRDWLFLADEFTPHPDGEASAQARAAEVIALRKRLAGQGIDLLVVVVPDKSRIAATHLGNLPRPAQFAGRLAQWTATLAQAGVDVVDLSDTLNHLQQNGHQQGRQAFLRTDSHWTESGAAAAAALVGQRALALVSIARTGSGLQLMSSETLPRPGDLVRLAGLDGLPPALQPRPESAQQSRFEALNGQAAAPGKAGAASKDNDDLFGDADLPTVAVIGSSFSRTSNFVPFLAEKLQARVANFALDGGDFAGAAKAYLASPAFKQTPPKLLIWEIPERVLQADRHNDHVE